MKSINKAGCIAAVALAASSLAACGSSSSGSDADSTGPIPIGVILSQTGSVASFGQSAKLGVDTAVKYFNAHGGVNGRKLDVHFCDDGSEVAGVSTCFKQLQSAHVAALIGPMANPVHAGAQLAQAAGIPEFALAVNADLVDPVKPFVFRPVPATSEETKAMVDYVKSQGWTKAAIIDSNDVTGQEYTKDLGQFLKADGIDIVDQETYGPTDTDMTPQLTKINASGAQVLLAPGGQDTVGPVVNDRASLRMTMPFVSGAGISGQSFIDLAGKNASGIVAFVYKVSVLDQLAKSDPQYDAIKTFVDQLPSGKSPDAYSALGWDTVHMLIQAMGTLKDPTDPTKVRDAVEKITNMAGALSVYSFSPDNHVGASSQGYGAAKFTGGKWVPIAE